jgi:hypothetical protein
MTPEEKLKKIKNKYAGRIRIALQKAAREIAQPIVDLIKLRTRELGENGNNEKLKIKQSTENYRKRYEDNLHPDTSPGTANLTATGQLLDALRARAGGGKVTIDIKPTKRKGELSGSKSKLNNNQVREYVEKNPSNEFLKLSEAEKKEVIDLAAEIINKELRGLS